MVFTKSLCSRIYEHEDLVNIGYNSYYEAVYGAASDFSTNENIRGNYSITREKFISSARDIIMNVESCMSVCPFSSAVI